MIVQKSKFYIAQETDEYIYIIDLGIDTKSVTNDVENVLSFLSEYNNLGNRRLIYWDSDSRIDEIIHENGVFKRFSPGHKGITGLPKRCLSNEQKQIIFTLITPFIDIIKEFIKTNGDEISENLQKNIDECKHSITHFFTYLLMPNPDHSSPDYLFFKNNVINFMDSLFRDLQ